MDKTKRKELENIIFYGNKKQERIDAFKEYLTWETHTERDKIEKDVFIGMAIMNRRELDAYNK